MPHSFTNSSSVSSVSGKFGGGTPRERVRRRLLPVEKVLSALLAKGLSPSFDPIRLGDNARTALLAEREALFILNQSGFCWSMILLATTIFEALIRFSSDTTLVYAQEKRFSN
jgi:hypothetical protein